MINLISKPTFITHTNNIGPKLLSGSLDIDTNKEFVSIFNRHCVNNKPLIIKKFEFNDKQKINGEFERIVNEAYMLLQTNGFNVDRTNGIIEFCAHTSYNKTICVPLSMKQDDNQTIPYKVDTCIFYIERHTGLVNGDYLLYEINTKKNKFLGLFSYYSTKMKLLNICDQMVVLLNGNLYYCPNSINGLGSRKCIRVQFKSVDRI